jgi:hypothetical protein
MTASLPSELLEVLEGSPTAEYVTVDGRGQPRVRPVRPSFHAGEPCIDVAPAPAERTDPRAALLFGEAVSSMVLVQGIAQPERDIVHVRPERVYAWPWADLDAEPALYDAHLDEVRSAHNEEPETGHAAPEGGTETWDPRLDAVGAAALAFVGPDGFPFAVRVPVQPDPAARVVRIGADPLGAPIEAGLGCLCAFGIEVRGDLVEERGGWLLRPHRVLG